MIPEPLSETEIARRIAKPLGFTRALLEQFEHEGLAARDEDDRWQLTPEGESRHVAALRDLRFRS